MARNVGRKKTTEMLLTGRAIDAATALAWGLVNDVVPADQLDQAIRNYTDIVLARSGAAIAIGKRTFYAQVERPLESAYQLGRRGDGLQHPARRRVRRHGRVIGKRQPTWRGR